MLYLYMYTTTVNFTGVDLYSSDGSDVASKVVGYCLDL